LPKLDLTKKRERLRRGRSRWNGPLFVLIAPLLLLAGSWGQMALVNIAGRPGVSSLVQQHIYSAIYWLKYNTPKDSIYLSVSDWRFKHGG